MSIIIPVRKIVLFINRLYNTFLYNNKLENSSYNYINNTIR